MYLDELILRFQQKDSTAFGALYEMYAKSICGVINSIVQDRERAEEICHDVFIKVWQNSGSYDTSKGRFFTWVLNIARNAAIDELRSKSHKMKKLNLSADFFVGILERLSDNGQEDVDVERIGRMVTKLKQKCIKLIELLYFKGYSQVEAAEKLEIPVGTVKSRNRNCIAQLRENVKKDNGH